MWQKRIFRIGAGCGIEIRGADLRVVALRSRSAGVTVLGRAVLHAFRERPAHEWGAEYAAFLKQHGLSHLAATVSLPRNEVIVRQIQLPPVSGKELAAAVAYQLETLHPFGEDEVCYAFAPLAEKGAGKSQIPVSVVIAEKSKVDAYADLFESAGIAVSAFTVTAASFYAGMRVRWDSPPAPFLISDVRHHKLEFFGESASHPAFSAEFDLSSMPAARVLQLAGAELRLREDEIAPLIACGRGESEEGDASCDAALGDSQTAGFDLRPVSALLPSPLAAPGDFDMGRDGAALAVALESACPRLGWRTNLLPPARRKSSSRWMYAPTAVLVAALLLLALAFVARPLIQNRNYTQRLATETAQLSKLAMQVNQTKAKSDEATRKADLLRSLTQRTQADLRILDELSALIPDTVWLNSLDLNDQGVQISGESATAAPLLGILNESKWLTNAAFMTSLLKVEGGERFQIAAERRKAEELEANPPPAVAAPAAAAPQAPASEPASSTLSTVGGEKEAGRQEGR
jgi:Tfp pilus assembly protein PilN